MVLQLGVMLAASVWSLIIPSIEMKAESGGIAWLPASIGIVLGVGALLLIDSFVEKNMNKNKIQAKKSKMLNFAITLHNIPEGMAVGIGFASSLTGNYGVSITSAMILAIGIGIQNIPEGMAVSLPLKSDGISSKKSFLLGVLSRNSRTNFCYNNNFNK